ncbi:MAG: protein-export chaperone SecB [Xanthomonadales bacterium]|nr:protein-export chaperone SecB [Xanthomonadales bacterium]
MADETANGAAGAAQTAAPQLNLQKIYVKDSSFEVPHAPQIFREEGQPELQMNIGQKITSVDDSTREVVLEITVTCTIGDKTAYLAEVKQAGIFGLTGFDQQQQEAVLATYCSNALFPYARQSISDLVLGGGFPPLLLQPINFDQLYAEQLRRRAEEGQAAPATDTGVQAGADNA